MTPGGDSDRAHDTTVKHTGRGDTHARVDGRTPRDVIDVRDGRQETRLHCRHRMGLSARRSVKRLRDTRPCLPSLCSHLATVSCHHYADFINLVGEVSLQSSERTSVSCVAIVYVIKSCDVRRQCDVIVAFHTSRVRK